MRRTRAFSRSNARPRGRSRRTSTVDLERYREIIPEWDAFMDAAGRPEPTVFRVRVGRHAPEALLKRLEDQGFRTHALEGMPGFFQVDAAPYPLSMTLEHWAGWLYVQQASTGVAAPALGPRPGERVLDLCSAPGGKTTHAAELMEETGCLVASDVSESRIRGLLGNAYRLGYTNLVVTAGDGREFPRGALFDRVMVDAPCSGEGTLRRRGGRAPNQSPSFLGYVTRAQEGLLRRAVELTRPGGTILYVTCTFAPEENEAVVDRVLREGLVDLDPLNLPVSHAPGVTAWEGRTFDARLEGAARIYPHHLDSGGLFLARLKKPGGGEAAPATVAGNDAARPGAVGRDAGAARGGSLAAAAWTPVPAVFPGEAAGEEEARELIARAGEKLVEDFGVDPHRLEGMGWVLRGGRLWVHTVDAWPLEAWEPGDWRPISVGFRAMDFDTRGRPRPTNDLLRRLDADIRSGVVELDDAELERLVGGEMLPSRDAPRGLVAFRWKDVVLGRGVSTAEGIRSEIPKARAADLARLLRRQAEAADSTRG
ncbi:MAG: RNA methyltransferase [Gemmatimonadota bacterium]